MASRLKPAVTRPRPLAANADINMTPMIDVLLVLLVIYSDRHDKTLYVMGDGKLRYGDIVAGIDAAKGAGVAKVGIVTASMRK
jgi:biopolymer transport protein ExbD